MRYSACCLFGEHSGLRYLNFYTSPTLTSGIFLDFRTLFIRITIIVCILVLMLVTESGVPLLCCVALMRGGIAVFEISTQCNDYLPYLHQSGFTLLILGFAIWYVC